ncbi:Na+/H+ antiporter subunit E [Naasia lichenicola]|uniref:Na+/H+ antiporter subunit E n=1 Tax=Naasia lichenicola TaxID=2565933 RepID=A0A4S4FMZ7_9MICO|nr:Na+/H+ antiporter subunit E [Naasia lichenicola]THG31833.1 Na+/H+ antiporter subunit E [Naasia lichenicola]
MSGSDAGRARRGVSVRRHGGEHDPDSRQLLKELGQQSPLLITLVLLWMVLWRSFTPIDLLAGIGVALLVTRVFELPPVQLSGRFNPWWLLVYLFWLAVEVVEGSFSVAARAFDFRRVPRSAVVEVRLITRSDFALTLIAITVSLIPGSLVLEVDRSNSTLFLHVLGTENQRDIERARERVRVVEHRLLRAIGSRDELKESSR